MTTLQINGKESLKGRKAMSIPHLCAPVCSVSVCTHMMQDRIEENADEFLRLMASEDAHFYFCGLKRMYSSVLETLQRIGAEKGLDTQVKVKGREHAPARVHAFTHTHVQTNTR